MASGFQDFIPAGKDATAYENGYQDFAPIKEPVVQELSKEEQLRLQRIANLARGREEAKARREAEVAKQEEVK